MGGVLKKLNTEPLYHPTIPLLGIYLEKTIIPKDTRTPAFTVVLFTMPRHRSNLNYHTQRTVEWIKNMVHICNGILLTHKKEWNNAICSNMDGPRDCHMEWRKSEEDKEMILLYVESKKVVQMNLLTKQKQSQTLKKQTYGYQRDEREKLGDWYTDIR